jgi:hypothetical protein
MSQIDPQQLAEKIARIIETERPSNELASIAASLDAINSRLDRLESASTNTQAEFRSPQSHHPSQEKFSIAEAIADQIFAGVSKEKTCTFEPSKPCDHCSMCSSRGF